MARPTLERVKICIVHQQQQQHYASCIPRALPPTPPPAPTIASCAEPTKRHDLRLPSLAEAPVETL